MATTPRSATVILLLCAAVAALSPRPDDASEHPLSRYITELVASDGPADDYGRVAAASAAGEPQQPLPQEAQSQQQHALPHMVIRSAVMLATSTYESMPGKYLLAVLMVLTAAVVAGIDRLRIGDLGDF